MFLAGVIPFKDIPEYQNAFEGFDRNHSGKVPNELLEPLLRSLGYNPTDEEVEDMIEDLGRETSFDFDSFMVIVSRHARSSKAEIEISDIFRTLDKENTGRIPVEVVKQTLTSTNHPLDDDDINEILKDLDIEDDNTVDIEDLTNVMLGFQ